ncbi:hypothetical protein GCM10010420_45740 [Streptomyces glaucosporus]|uniref:Uncharacterized protein n=1 Tax=Streptomyces glaucosporus TaxID=284044 RepID=A0ABP5VXB6_9ACTN
MWLPRAVSVRVYEAPEPLVPRVTRPLYIPVPVPVWTPSHSASFFPVAASVTTWSSLGVPSSWTPVTRVSQARTGLPSAAQTTLRGAFSASAPAVSCAVAAFRADFSAAVADTSAVVLATLMRAEVALVTPRAPSFFSWTTRSPPRTGRPS